MGNFFLFLWGGKGLWKGARNGKTSRLFKMSFVLQISQRLRGLRRARKVERNEKSFSRDKSACFVDLKMLVYENFINIRRSPVEREYFYAQKVRQDGPNFLFQKIGVKIWVYNVKIRMRKCLIRNN